MRTIYSILVRLVELLLPLTSLFSSKMKEFVEGRKQVLTALTNTFSKKDQVYWFHAASLGEYEQALPVILAIKEKEPHRKILLSFFSPSGYRVKKGKTPATLEVYLPLDTPQNARKFLTSVSVEKAFFIKYEIWPNFLFELQKQQVKTYLISALFRENQMYFKPWGVFFRQALQHVDYFFVQTHASAKLLNCIGFNNVMISGDTRYDRVSQQLAMNNQLDFMDAFVGKSICFVLGSTWPEDEAIFIDFINKNPKLKYVIAPHQISGTSVQKLQSKLKVPSVRYTQRENELLETSSVLILDTVGLLTKVYAYAHIAYVGGGMGVSGLHNILEPATFGVPIIIGKNFEKFPEAKELQTYAGLFSVSDATSFQEIATKLASDEKFRNQTGIIAEHFIQARTGATQKMLEVIL